MFPRFISFRFVPLLSTTSILLTSPYIKTTDSTQNVLPHPPDLRSLGDHLLHLRRRLLRSPRTAHGGPRIRLQPPRTQTATPLLHRRAQARRAITGPVPHKQQSGRYLRRQRSELPTHLSPARVRLLALLPLLQVIPLIQILQQQQSRVPHALARPPHLAENVQRERI